MNIKVLAVVCALILVAHFTDADRGGPKKDKVEAAKPTRGTLSSPSGSRKGAHSSEEVGGSSEERPDASPAGDRSSWNRVLNENVSAHESAFAPSNGSVIVVKSNDRFLREVNITGAVTVLDFTNNSKVEVIRVRNACFITERLQQSYQEIIDILTARNNTNVSIADRVALNGTGPQLSREEAQIVFQQYPTVARLCRKFRIVRTTSDVVESPDVEVIAVPAFDALINISVNKPTPPPTPKGLLGVLRGGKSGERTRH
ncbi:hypothetical protein Bpfe_009987 [Biomphalaria pfeifferi]|uniref:NtA domain-containing protein n=1 Tax=Biomphalaria pfeifferi TaxID=112525 RepID=A0AAD8BV98_BIOPF|nr:hypothetical protein Bpfe_009987 [Biomphalaria pfeifferi]